MRCVFALRLSPFTGASSMASFTQTTGIIMAISKEQEAEILRYHFVERWGVHTIASQLKLHHSTVDRVIAQAGMPKAERTQRASILDPYLGLIIETLEKYPRLTAERLYGMAQERGYTGGRSHFRARVAQLRPRPQTEAYLRLKTLPAEQAQVDWGHFHYLTIGKAKRPLMAFVMVLSWSRQIFLRFYLNQRMANFLHGHVAAFEAWGGIPKVLLYDNLKSAVLERQGDVIRFHPTLLALSAHYRFEPRPVALARGNEKGRVERAIRYVRDNFFAGRQWQDIDDLNAQAQAWCVGQSACRPCPEDRSLSVREAFEQEKPQLCSLPDNPYPTDEQIDVSVGKTPYIRFDLNDYSVPHTHVRRMLSVQASLTTVRILEAGEVIAQHPRSYAKAVQIEDPTHIEALLKSKHQARFHRGQDRLAHAAPSSSALLEQAAQRGQPLKTLVSSLLDLLSDYGGAEVELAITEALQQQVPHPNAVRQVLERRREQRHQPPPIAITLPDHAKANLVIRPASLAPYDQLNTVVTTETQEQDIIPTDEDTP
jgi:transposase